MTRTLSMNYLYRSLLAASP